MYILQVELQFYRYLKIEIQQYWDEEYFLNKFEYINNEIYDKNRSMHGNK